MGLQSALTTALTGLQAAETTIDVVGNNVANSSTVGFKESEAVFATQFLQTISIGGAPTANQGGTNPRQVGLGVKVAAITPNFTQGTIEISSNPLDVAIQGDGFLIVQSGTGELYTRNGQLQLNANNEVVTTTGQRVLGFGVTDDFKLQSNLVPLTIPLGQERVAQATENAFFTGVLNPAVQPNTQPEIVQSSVLSDGSILVPELDGFSTSTNVTEDAAPPAGTVSVEGTGSGPATGRVRYRIAYLDENDEVSTLTPLSDMSLDHAGGGVQLGGLPTLPAGVWENLAIYRTVANGDTFYPIDMTGYTVGEPTFVDHMTDDDLDDGDPVDDTVIPPGTYNYYVTYYDSTAGQELETQPTSKIGPIEVNETTGGRLRFDLSMLEPPTAGNQDEERFDKVRIYRANGNESEYRMVGEIDAPAAGDTSHSLSFIDNASDVEWQGSTEVLSINGPTIDGTTPLTQVSVRQGDVTSRPFQIGELTFAADKDGVRLDAKTLNVTATTTVNDLMSFMQDAMGIDTSLTGDFPPEELEGVEQAGVTISADGRIQVVSNLGEENAISIPLTGLKLIPEGETTSESVSLGFNSTQSADGPGTSSEFVVYDSLGLPLSVRVTTVLETKDSNSTTYRWYATSADNEPSEGLTTVVGDGTLVFDQNGDLDENTVAQIAVLRNDTASESPLEIALDFSSVKSLGEVDALNNNISSLNVSSQDGFPPGVLTDFIISEDGLIQGQFSNGTQRTVGQLMMARFTNNSGLRQVGDSLFQVGVNSGEPVRGRPGEDGIGTLTAGAVELSNTDIGQNLIELILASTQYRGGARVISASQELLDELLALRR